LHQALKDAGYPFWDPDDVQGGAEKQRIAHQALGADVYLMSANAIALTGEIVSLDGIGNRVAALSFGPKMVILIAGMNKVEPTLEAAITRAKTKAAPLILLAFKQDYGSYEELAAAAENAYSQMVITRMSPFKGRLKVILVGEDLGY
jgi:L-lactate utilization protein LutB